jgi:triosephosphate isomerase
MRKRIVAGNWKMNLLPQEVNELMSGLNSGMRNSELAGVELVLCPPAIYLEKVVSLGADTFKIGAQNAYFESSGAFTGEVSAPMLAAVGATYCIVGHSERRSYFGDTDEVVQRKIRAVLDAGLTAILCCGEQLEQRESGLQNGVVGEQVIAALQEVDEREMSRVVVAYEPVWAIGTGRTATSDQAQEMHAAIRKTLAQQFSQSVADNTPILYGGSCKPENAKELFSAPDVDGGLIGGASLHADDFLAIARSFN